MIGLLGFCSAGFRAPLRAATNLMSPAIAPDFWSILPALQSIFFLCLKTAQMPPSLFTGRSLTDRDPEVLNQLLPWWEWLYRYYFRVTSDGWEHLPVRGRTLLVGSHNGGIAAPDMLMLMCEWYRRFGTERLAYALMHPKVWKASPYLAKLAAQSGALQAEPKMAIAALRREAAVLVYPGGAQDLFRPYPQRHKICFYGRQGFIKIALREHVPIVPVISCGAHETLIILADLYPQVNQLHQLGLPWPLGIDPEVFPLYLGLPWGLSVGPLPNLPLPLHIHNRICAPIVFERYGIEAAQDRFYVRACYEKVCSLMQCSLDRLVQDYSKMS